MAEYKLAIDLGSTEFKAAIYTSDMRLHGTAAHKLLYSRNGAKVELSVKSALKAFAEIIKESVESTGISIDKISSIGITSQAQTFAVSDENGRFLTSFISWLDMRASETCKTMKLEDFAAHSSISGILPNMQICILKHLFDKNPEIVRKNIKIIPLPTYLIMLLTGQCVSDNNIAALSGLFSLKENNYWQPALDVLKIDRNNLPDIIEIGNVAGKTQRDNPLGISKNIPVFSCGNDQTAGAFGAGLQASDVLITLGTAQTVYRCCEKMPTPNVQFRGYYPGGLYYSMCAGPGGDLITKAIEKVPELKDFNTFAKFAANADATIAPVFYVKSETNEVFWSNDRAGLAEKALAVLDFLADEIFDFFVKLNGSPKNIKTIYVAGGGQNIPTWVNAIEKKLSHKIKCISYSPIHGTALMMNKDR
jgi:sugar (pentulose or hexulose) kinase